MVDADAAALEVDSEVAAAREVASILPAHAVVVVLLADLVDVSIVVLLITCNAIVLLLVPAVENANATHVNNPAIFLVIAHKNPPADQAAINATKLATTQESVPKEAKAIDGAAAAEEEALVTCLQFSVTNAKSTVT